MKERDALLGALTLMARRLRWNAVLREAARMACVVLGALVLYQILVTAIPIPAVTDALAVLLMLTVVALGGCCALRGLWPVPLEEAAAVADEQLDLKDELKSGYWFAGRRDAAPLVTMQIRRAAATAQRVPPGAAFPIVWPRSGIAALGLAITAGVLGWHLPRFAAELPRSGMRAADETAARGDSRTAQTPSISTAALRQEIADSRESEQPGTPKSAWAQLESAVQALEQGEAAKELATALQFRDAARAVQALEELDRKRVVAGSPQSTARAPGETSRAGADLLARLQDLFGPGGNVPSSALEGDKPEALTQALALARQLNNDLRASGANTAARHDLDTGTNPLQAALPLERFGPREARLSQGQGGEFEGTTDVEGGAMGRRVTQSNLGAGGKPSTNEANFSNIFEGEDVLGSRTMRLAAQFKRVKIEGGSAQVDDSQATADAAYVATRAQLAQTAYENALRHSRFVTESGMNGEQVPIAYRGAVKNYFLELNRIEK